MLHRTTLLGLAVIILTSFSSMAQESTTAESLHPKVQYYVDMLDLTDTQTETLQAVYMETSQRGEELEGEIKEARLAQGAGMKKATPSEKAKFRDTMNDLSKEKIVLTKKRDDTLQEIMTPEQKKVFEDNKASRPKTD